MSQVDYDSLVAGPDAVDVALAATGDKSVAALNEALTERVLVLRLVPENWSLFAVPSALPERFDVYLLDAENVFVGVQVAQAEGDVIRAGERLMVLDQMDWVTGETKVDSGVPGFELINGFMTIWGEKVVVQEVTTRGDVVSARSILTNGRLVRLVFKDRYWGLHVSRGRRTLFGSASLSLRFIVDGVTFPDVTLNMAEKFTTVGKKV